MSDEPRLENCPRCGWVTALRSRGGHHKIVCGSFDECRLSGPPSRDRDEAIREWNGWACHKQRREMEEVKRRLQDRVRELEEKLGISHWWEKRGGRNGPFSCCGNPRL